MDELPSSAPADRNKIPILEKLRPVLADRRRVLEIGGGTGQHAVFLAGAMPHLTWLSTDLPGPLKGLAARIQREGPDNCLAPVELDVLQFPWPVSPVDVVYTANTFHIMSWEAVQAFFRGVDDVLEPGGRVCVYGPFRYQGRFTSPGNADFDHSLRKWNPDSGIRDFEGVDALARERGLELLADYAMPANNQLLVWTRSG